MPLRPLWRAVGATFGLVLTLVAGSARAATPIGYLDSAGCDLIAGWSQDPDEPTKGIDVHLYLGGPAGSGAPAVPTTANQYRADLCTAIGSCEHGFSIPSPLSLHDGAPHDIHAYGIDSMGGPNPELGNSPKALACPPEMQSGVRRRVDGSTTYDAWGFSSFWDLLPLGDAGTALPEGPEVPAEPELVKAESADELFLVDHGVRRLVDAGAVVAWRLDPAKATVLPPDEVQALVLGTPLRPRPVLFIAGALWLVDDVEPEGASSASATGAAATSGAATGAGGSGGGGAGGGGTPAAAAASDDGGCSLEAPGVGAATSSQWIALAIALGCAVGARRRRA